MIVLVSQGLVEILVKLVKCSVSIFVGAIYGSVRTMVPRARLVASETIS